MRAYKCDRCGRYFEGDAPEGIHIAYTFMAAPTTFRDLCPDCQEALKKWLNEGGDK